MTRNSKYLSHITFGRGESGVIYANSLLNVPNLPNIPNVSLVDGLRANLLSINQWCDDKLRVQFTSDGCNVLDPNGDCVIH